MKKDIQDKLDSFLTVADLIEALKQEDPNAPVCITSDYHDRGHTQQILQINEVCSTEYMDTEVAETGYSETGLCIKDNEREADDADSIPNLIYISAY